VLPGREEAIEAGRQAGRRHSCPATSRALPPAAAAAVPSNREKPAGRVREAGRRKKQVESAAVRPPRRPRPTRRVPPSTTREVERRRGERMAGEVAGQAWQAGAGGEK